MENDRKIGRDLCAPQRVKGPTTGGCWEGPWPDLWVLGGGASTARQCLATGESVHSSRRPHDFVMGVPARQTRAAVMQG